MREVVLRVPRIAVEDVLDRLLPLVPGGIREVGNGGEVELRMRGEQVPSLTDLRRVADRWPCRLVERDVSDDWRERRVADYAPEVIGGLVVRPEWAPPPAVGMMDIVLVESAAFGGGTHPTTRTCLELLLDVRPSGAFVDLGCGTGVLALLAAKLGWDPVCAVDVQPASVETTRRNAELNNVRVDARQVDLAAEPPPAGAGFAANVPASVHELIAERLPEPRPSVGLLSGFGEPEAEGVLGAYASGGLVVRRRIVVHGWMAAVVARR
jgi:ribosomal protein L11 methyltransferase